MCEYCAEDRESVSEHEIEYIEWERDEAMRMVNRLEDQIHEDGGFIDRIVGLEEENAALKSQIHMLESERDDYKYGRVQRAV